MATKGANAMRATEGARATRVAAAVTAEDVTSSMEREGREQGKCEKVK